jgi:hydroxyacylglutathione hydrolase
LDTARSTAHSTDPLIQVHKFDNDSFILRVSKCFSFEGNFIYLLFGDTRAILVDTGGPPGDDAQGTVLPIRNTVDTIVSEWLQRRGITRINLMVAHTHSHGDHAFWDSQFVGRPRTSVVRPNLHDVKSAFKLPDWPDGEANLELGVRNLTAFPIPGHERSRIAVYDPRMKVLLTGDMLYPGLLTV